MLNFCTAEDIASVIPTAGRFGDAVRRARQSTTAEFNRFMRRRLDWETGIVEFVSANDSPLGQAYKVWLLKKNIDPTTFSLSYAWNRDFGNEENTLTLDDYILDAEKGKVTIYAPLRESVNSLRIAYSGGIKAAEVSRDPITQVITYGDTMDLSDHANLVTAAVDQTVYSLRRTLGNNQGQSADTEKNGNNKAQTRIMVGGLLKDVAAALIPYRRPLIG